MITIDKAIKNLKAGRKDSGMIPPEEYTPTLNLAVEALKVIREKRTTMSFHPDDLLPGETKT